MGTAQNAHNGLMSPLGTCDIPTIDHARGFREDDAHGVAQYVDSAATRVACAIQLKVGREYPKYARFLEPFLCKGTNTQRHGRTGTSFLKHKTVDDLDHVVPLTVFTHASPSSLQKSCDVISLSSLLAQGHKKRFPSTPVEAVSSNLVDKSIMVLGTV